MPIYKCKTFLVLPALLVGLAWHQDAPATGRSDEVSKALEGITEKLVKDHVAYLASDELEGRGAGYPGNDKAAEYIAKHFKETGLKPIGDGGTYFQSFTFGRAGLKTKNCVGLLEGSDPKLKDEVLILGGHFDHLGKAGQSASGRQDRPTGSDKIWNGADDNATGTAAVLAVARAMSSLKTRPKRSILFMAFSAEEWGSLGARHYVNSPILPLQRTKTMINLDQPCRLIRAPKDAVDTATLYCFADFQPLIQVIGAAAKEAGVSVNPVASRQDGTQSQSDSEYFAQKKISTVFFVGGGPHNWHVLGDHADQIDYDHLYRITRTVFLTLVDLAQADQIPAYKKP